MDARELLDGALAIAGGNQAELARRLNRSETTISRWVAGRNGIDFESALRLARLMRLPAREVVEACGLDPELVPESTTQETAADLQDGFVAEMALRVRAMHEAGMVAELEHAKWAAKLWREQAVTQGKKATLYPVGASPGRAMTGRGRRRLTVEGQTTPNPNASPRQDSHR